jgi:outer membrane protein assembly factor BamE (lipoprotein component of BamABCDE complex)
MTCRSLLSTLLVLLLSACATPQSLKPGASVDEARSTLGRPTAETRLPDGGSRLQYSGQPFNQSVVNVDFDGQGRLRQVAEVMTDEAFSRVRAGKDTQADVLRDFGRPADVFHYRLSNETAFMYRYFTHGGFKAAMFIYFDPAGVVKRTETGLDPWSLGGSDRND